MIRIDDRSDRSKWAKSVITKLKGRHFLKWHDDDGEDFLGGVKIRARYIHVKGEENGIAHTQKKHYILISRYNTRMKKRSQVHILQSSYDDLKSYRWIDRQLKVDQFCNEMIMICVMCVWAGWLGEDWGKGNKNW